MAARWLPVPASAAARCTPSKQLSWFLPLARPQAAGQKWFTLAFITADQVRKVPAWAGTIGLEKQFLMDQVS